MKKQSRQSKRLMSATRQVVIANADLAKGLLNKAFHSHIDYVETHNNGKITGKASNGRLVTQRKINNQSIWVF